MRLPYKILNDLLQESFKVDHEIGGCFNFRNGKYQGCKTMRGNEDSIDIPLDNCTVSFHSHPPRTEYPGYRLNPPSPEDMRETIGHQRTYILLTQEGVYQYGSILPQFGTCDYLALYELVHTGEPISEEQEDAVFECIEHHHGKEQCDLIIKRLSSLSGSEEDYLDFVNDLFQLMGSFLIFYPYPLTEDIVLEDIHLLTDEEDP